MVTAVAARREYEKVSPVKGFRAGWMGDGTARVNWEISSVLRFRFGDGWGMTAAENVISDPVGARIVDANALGGRTPCTT